MRFMLLLKSSAATEAGAMPSAALLEAMTRFNEALVGAGALLAGEGLHASSKGYRLAAKQGRVTVSTGPFADASSLVAGYWLLNVKSKAEAIAWAERCPVGESGEIEVREVFELDDIPKQENESGWREEEAELRAAPPPAVDPTKRKYVVLVKASARGEAGELPTEAELAAMGEVIADLAAKGALLGCEGLKASSGGARVLFANGKPRVVDGPFAEAKELVAGFTLLQAANDEEALAWARRHAIAAEDNAMELRRVFAEADFAPELAAAFETERRLRAKLEAGA